MQTKQSFLSFHHDTLGGQARGWGSVQCTANSAPRGDGCPAVKTLPLTLEFHPRGPQKPPSQVSHVGISLQRQGRGVSGIGLRHSRRGQAGHGGAWTIFSLKTQAKEGVSENTVERGWFFSSQRGWFVLMPPPKVRPPRLPPAGERAQEQRAPNPFTQGETHWPPLTSTQEAAAAGLSREQRFGLRNVPMEGVKIYLLSSPQAHLLKKNLIHLPQYPSWLPSHRPFSLSMYLFLFSW